MPNFPRVSGREVIRALEKARVRGQKAARKPCHPTPRVGGLRRSRPQRTQDRYAQWRPEAGWCLGRGFSGRAVAGPTDPRMSHKRKRRDQCPGLAASHAPTSSVRRTRRGARLATTPCGAACGRCLAGSPPATTILGARPLHAHGAFASDSGAGFPSAPPLERRCGAPSKTTSSRHSRVHQQLSPPRGTLRSLSPPGPRFRGRRAS